MTNPEDRQNLSPLHKVVESPDSLSEEELEAISGGVSTAIVPQVLRRAFSESDLTRLAHLHPTGIDHTPPASPARSDSSREEYHTAGSLPVAPSPRLPYTVHPS